MFRQDTRSIKAARGRGKEIPIYYSSVPRARPAAKIAVAMLMVAMFGTIVGISAAHAGTDYPDNDTTMILAQQSQSGGSANRPGRPPREALEACAEQTSGSRCGFSGPDGEQIPGTCLSPQANVPLACAPADMPLNG